MVNRRPHLELIAPEASPAEAAAIVGALEQFMRASALRPVAAPAAEDPWRRAAILEGASRSQLVENAGSMGAVAPGSTPGQVQVWGPQELGTTVSEWGTG